MIKIFHLFGFYLAIFSNSLPAQMVETPAMINEIIVDGPL
jgi:hypothetical protein